MPETWVTVARKNFKNVGCFQRWIWEQMVFPRRKSSLLEICLRKVFNPAPSIFQVTTTKSDHRFDRTNQGLINPRRQVVTANRNRVQSTWALASPRGFVLSHSPLCGLGWPLSPAPQSGAQSSVLGLPESAPSIPMYRVQARPSSAHFFHVKYIPGQPYESLVPLGHCRLVSDYIATPPPREPMKWRTRPPVLIVLSILLLLEDGRAAMGECSEGGRSQHYMPYLVNAAFNWWWSPMHVAPSWKSTVCRPESPRPATCVTVDSPHLQLRYRLPHRL